MKEISPPLPHDAPRYRRLADVYGAAIRAGELTAGDPLPPERRIAERHGVSRVTVRKALARLAQDGLIESRHGSGHYVSSQTPTKRLEAPLNGVRGFSEEARSRGMTPAVKWLERAMGRPDPEEALALGLGPDARVARLMRLRLADGAPVAIENAAVPDWALPDAELVDLSLYEAMAAQGTRPARALQRIAAAALDARKAALLESVKGAPVLFTTRVGYLANGRAVEHSRTWSRADRWDFITELA